MVTPERIFEIAQGFMASKHLFAASELGLFEALGEGPIDLDGLAARTGLTRRTARISADAMVAIGLLERQGDRYANGAVAATFLSGQTPADFRPLLKFWDRLSYPAWQDLSGALGRGRPAHEIFDLRDFTPGPDDGPLPPFPEPRLPRFPIPLLDIIWRFIHKIWWWPYWPWWWCRLLP